MDRTTALALALTARGYVASDEGAHVRVEAPADSTATVQPLPLCTFTLTEDLRPVAARRWAAWTAELRAAVDAVWPEVEHFPARPYVEPPPPAIVQREVAYDHAYALGPAVDSAFELSHDEAQRGRCRVVTSWHSRRHGTGLVTDRALWAYDGPLVHWHAWGVATAWTFGAARGWSSLESAKIDGHPAEPHVRSILLRAAEGEALPDGIVALDLRGLPASIAHALVQAIATRARATTRKGVICLCDDQAAAWIGRTVDLDVSS